MSNSEKMVIDVSGEVVTWESPGAPVPHKALVDALTDNSLDATLAHPLKPRYAFTRGCRKMAKARVIRRLKSANKNEVRFQLTREFMGSQGLWEYDHEAVLALDVKTGYVSCPEDIALARVAQGALDAALDERTPGDVGKVVRKIFSSQGDLFPLRQGGGVYFVPSRYESLVANVANMLSTLGGKVSRFTLDKAGATGAMRDAVKARLQELVEEHLTAVKELGEDASPRSLKAAAKRVKETRAKVEQYKLYLEAGQAKLDEALEEAQEELAKRLELVTSGEGVAA